MAAQPIVSVFVCVMKRFWDKNERDETSKFKRYIFKLWEVTGLRFFG